MLKHPSLLKAAAFISAVIVLWFWIGETFKQPQSPPIKSHYSLRFSVIKPQSARTMSGNNVQTSMRVHISRWDQNYDKTHYQVFMVLTTTNTSVWNIYTDTPNTFVSGGWYNVDKLNRIMKMHSLATIINRQGDHSWLYVSAKAPITATITADTQTAPPRRSWRAIIIAEKHQGSNISMMWSKVFQME